MAISDPKRILIFALAYFPVVGGAEVAIKEITGRINPKDFAFDLITYRFSSQYPHQQQLGNVAIYRLGLPLDRFKTHYGHKFFKLFWSFLAAKKALLLHRQNPYGAVWCVMANYAAAASFLFKLLNFSSFKPRLLLTLQEGDEEGYILRKVGVFRPIWRSFFRNADHVQTISNYLADLARRQGASSAIEVVPNGVDIAKLTAPINQRDLNYLREKLGIEAGEKIIITTSRLVHKNAINILIQAISLLEKRELKVKCLILGTGPDEHKLKQLSQDLGVPNELMFMGHISPDEIPKYLRISDIFVRASRSEGMGNSFIEAMAVGLPVIGTPVGGIVDFLKDGETGLFCKVDDAEDLADKIRILFEDETLYKKLSQNGRELSLKNYSWDVITKKMNKIFTNIAQINTNKL